MVFWKLKEKMWEGSKLPCHYTNTPLFETSNSMITHLQVILLFTYLLYARINIGTVEGQWKNRELNFRAFHMHRQKKGRHRLQVYNTFHVFQEYRCCCNRHDTQFSHRRFLQLATWPDNCGQATLHVSHKQLSKNLLPTMICFFGVNTMHSVA